MTIEDVVIIGGGGMGRETHQWILDRNAVTPTFRVLGFLDGAKTGGTIHGLPVFGDVDWLEAHREVGAVVAIGAPAVRRRIFARLRDWGVRSPSVIHPGAQIGANVSIGAGSIVCAGVIVTTDITIGAGVILNFHMAVGHDAVIADLCTLSPGVHVSGAVRMGEGCDVGAGASFIPGVTVGAWSVIGAGACVVDDLPGNVVAVGVPARAIKTRPPGWHEAP